MESNPTLVWYRGHDLRVLDHPALTAAAASGTPVVALYVHQCAANIGPIQKWYLHHSLSALSKELSNLGVVLLVRQTNSAVESAFVVAQLVTALSVQTVLWNRLYGCEAKEVDDLVREKLDECAVSVNEFLSAELLLEPEECIRDEPHQFTDFQGYARFWRSRFSNNPPPPPMKHLQQVNGIPSQEIMRRMSNAGAIDVSVESDWKRWFYVQSLGLVDGMSPDYMQQLRRLRAVGCVEAHETLERFLHSFKFRDFHCGASRRDALLSGCKANTSCMSPHIRFGEISPRVVYHEVMRESNNVTDPKAAKWALESAKRYIKNLCLREFGYYILWRYPDAASKPIVPEFEVFPWDRSDRARRNASWVSGKTGFPIVDAAMRQLETEGWIHNRLRFLVASFYVKYLLLPWPNGAKHLFHVLVDGDEACNSLGWQWAAGCNSDSFPFSTLVNPITLFKGSRSVSQAADYIRKYVPELAGLPDNLVFKPWQANDDQLKKSNLSIVPQPKFEPKSGSLAYEYFDQNHASSVYPMRIVNCPEARQRARRSMELMRRIFAAQRPSRPIIADQSLEPPEYATYRADRRNNLRAITSSLTSSTLMVRTSVISETVSNSGEELNDNMHQVEGPEAIRSLATRAHVESSHAEPVRVKSTRAREEPAATENLESKSKRARTESSTLRVATSDKTEDALSISGFTYSPVLSDCPRSSNSFATEATSIRQQLPSTTSPDLLQIGQAANPETPDFSTDTRSAQSPSVKARKIAVTALLSPSYRVSEETVLARKAQIENKEVRSRKADIQEAFQKSMDIPIQEPPPDSDEETPPLQQKNLTRQLSPESRNTTPYPLKRVRSLSPEVSQERTVDQVSHTPTESIHSVCAKPTASRTSTPPVHVASSSRSALARSTDSNIPRQSRQTVPSAPQAGNARPFCAPTSVPHMASSIPHGRTPMYQPSPGTYYSPTTSSNLSYAWQVQYPRSDGGTYGQTMQQRAEHPGYAVVGPQYNPYSDPRAYTERRGYPTQNAPPRIVHPGHHEGARPMNHAGHTAHPPPPGNAMTDARHAIAPGIAYNLQYQPGPYQSDLRLHHRHGHVGHQMAVGPLMVVRRFAGAPVDMSGSSGATVGYPMIGMGGEIQGHNTENSMQSRQSPHSRNSRSDHIVPSDRTGRMEIARRMAAMDYDDPKHDGKHKEQWQAIALHLINKYEFCDDTNRQTSKSYVRLCVIKDQLREANQNGPRVTVNHCKQVFDILQLPYTGEWDRRGHGGVRGPYVYGLRPKQSP